MRKIWDLVVLILFVAVNVAFFQGCSNEEAGSSTTIQEEAQEEISESVFSDSVTQFNVAVAYEDGAEPRTGNIELSSDDVWDITLTSYQALFQNHSGRVINVPKTLGEMTALADQGVSDWSSTQLIALGNEVSSNLVSGTERTITVIFLNGNYNGSTSTLGVQFTGYPFAFVFKDVVLSVGGTTKQQQYVEQATVVHEIGHAVGLVNNGLPMAAAHEDQDHPKHTTNSDGVMYWAVESSDNVLATIGDIILGNELDLFGAESKADGQAYHPE